MNGVGYLSKLA